jgi:hypothetical protein
MLLSMIPNEWVLPLLAGLTGLLLISWGVRRVRAARRRRRPPQLHPKLAKYGGHEEVAAQRRREAQRIVATSSTSSIAGYRILRQIEAVFVDGFRRTDEAIEGLKAVAAMKGANGVINVRHQAAPNGKYEATGDAVWLVQEGAESSERSGSAQAAGPSETERRPDKSTDADA